MISSKDLTQHIIIEEQGRKFDDSGGYKKQWVVKYKTWAKVESLFNKRQIGHELAIAKHIRSANYYEFTIRYKPDLDHKMRVIWNDKILNIVKVIDISVKKIFQTLIAEEVV
jgi:SPP1 family predicted phage head-tail adaptor